MSKQQNVTMQISKVAKKLCKKCLILLIMRFQPIATVAKVVDQWNISIYIFNTTFPIEQVVGCIDFAWNQ